MITIHQGRAVKKPYFLIADPEKSRAKIGDEVLCINPKTLDKTKGLVVSRYSFNWDIDPMGGLIRLEYGVEPQVLRAALEAMDPAFNAPNVSFLLVQETI